MTMKFLYQPSILDFEEEGMIRQVREKAVVHEIVSQGPIPKIFSTSKPGLKEISINDSVFKINHKCFVNLNNGFLTARKLQKAIQQDSDFS